MSRSYGFGGLVIYWVIYNPLAGATLIHFIVNTLIWTSLTYLIYSQYNILSSNENQTRF